MNTRNKKQLIKWRKDYYDLENFIELTPQDNKILKRWYIRRNIAEGTIREYNIVLTQLCNVTNKTIKEIYDEILDEEDQHVAKQRRAYNDDVIDIQTFMKEYAQISESTMRTRTSIIKSFYESLGVDISSLMGRYGGSPNPENVEQELPKELIRMMMDVAGNQDKAIISFMALTGQAQREVSNLTLQQLADAFNKAYGDKLIMEYTDFFNKKDEILSFECVQLKMYRQKVKGYYWTYLPREATEHILHYLRERQFGRNQKLRIHSLEDHVFVTKNGTPHKRDNVGKRVTRVGDLCGFNEPENFDKEIRMMLTRKDGNHRIFKSHNLRKYFATTCKRYGGGVSLDNRVFSGIDLADFWIGHKDSRSISAYIQHSEQDNVAMMEQYLKILPYLSLETEVRTFDAEERKEFEAMKKDYDNLKEDMLRLQEYLGLRKEEEELLEEMDLD